MQPSVRKGDGNNLFELAGWIWILFLHIMW